MTQSVAPGICHLSYISRSGSTFFAQLLSERYRVCVTPEASLPAEMLGVNGFEPPSFATRGAAASYLESILRLTKLADWRIDPAAALDRLRGFPASGVDLFNALLEAYRDARSPGDPIVCYKGDPVMPWEVARALRANPRARAIHVVRDPRAILSSQKTSRYAYAGGSFSYSEAHTAMEWRKLTAAVRSAGDRELWFRYEDLIGDPDGELGRVAAFLGAEPRGVDEASRFLDTIAEAERHLHQNVGKPPDPAQIGRWRKTLDARAAALLQEMLRDEMRELGYAAEADLASPGRLAIAVSHGRYRLLLGLHQIRRQTRNMTSDPGYFAGKILAKAKGAMRSQKA